MNVARQLKLIQRFLQDPHSDEWDRDELLEFLNFAQEVMYKEIVEADESYFEAIEEYNVTAAPNDSLEFDLPSDCAKPKTVERLSSGSPIPGSFVEFQDRNIYGAPQTYSGMGATGPVYYLRGTKIGIVSPTTSYTLRLYYIKTLSDLDQDGNTSEIPSEHHRLMCLYAAKLAMSTEGQALEPDLLTEFDRLYQQFKTFVDTRKRQQPSYVRYIPD